jgi:hypothetical protein
MEVNLTPDFEAAELAQVRQTLDTRYDDIKSGRVTPVDGEEAFSQLRQKSQAERSNRS